MTRIQKSAGDVRIADLWLNDPADTEKKAPPDHDQGHHVGHRVRQKPPADAPGLLPENDVGQKKQRGTDQRDVEQEGHDGQNRVAPGVHAHEGDNPVHDGTQRVEGAHVGEHHGVLASREQPHGDQAVKATPDKKDKSDPGQGTTDEIVDRMHLVRLLSSQDGG